jgi:hypothetical protein
MPLPTYVVAVDLGQVHDPTAIAVLERRVVPTGRIEIALNLNAYVIDGADEPLTQRRPQTVGSYHIVHLERLPLGTSYVAIPPRLSTIQAQVRRRWLEACWEAEHEAVLARRPRVAPYPTADDAPIDVVVDQTGVGRPVVDLLREADLEPIAVSIHGGAEVVRVSSREWRTPKRLLVGAVQAALQARRLQAAASLPDWPVLKAELANFKAKISASGHDTYAAGDGPDDWRTGGAHDDLVLAVALGIWASEERARSAPVAGAPPLEAYFW